jgi:hypothetical protein
MVKQLIVFKEGDQAGVRLREAAQILDQEVFPLDFRFDTMLVTSIDKVLKRNRIDRVSPLDVLMEGFVDESSMATLIARSVVAALKIKLN